MLVGSVRGDSGGCGLLDVTHAIETVTDCPAMCVMLYLHWNRLCAMPLNYLPCATAQLLSRHNYELWGYGRGAGGDPDLVRGGAKELHESLLQGRPGWC